MSEIEAYVKYNIELATDELEKSGEISNYARCLIDSANYFKKNSEAMSEISRLKELENQQLAQDKAEFVEALKAVVIQFDFDTNNEYEYLIIKEAKELLEKHK